jgi:hypothetical protein
MARFWLGVCVPAILGGLGAVQASLALPGMNGEEDELI